jgi:NitT/TauT family transport system ATP-binding protein
LRKTTLLRILAGLDRQTSGSIEVARDGDSSRPLNSMVFQEQSIFPWLSARDNVAFASKRRASAAANATASSNPLFAKSG